MKMFSFFKTIKNGGPLIWLTVAAPLAPLMIALESASERIGPELTTANESHRIASSNGVEQITDENTGILFDFESARVYALTHTTVQNDDPFETTNIVTSSKFLSDFSTYSTPQEITAALEAGCGQAEKIIAYDPSEKRLYRFMPTGFDEKNSTAAGLLAAHCA